MKINLQTDREYNSAKNTLLLLLEQSNIDSRLCSMIAGLREALRQYLLEGSLLSAQGETDQNQDAWLANETDEEQLEKLGIKL